MSLKRVSIATFVGAALFVSGTVDAGFNGLQIQHHATVTTPAGQREVYRIYARFTLGSDTVTAWGSTPSTPASNFHTGPCTTSPFYQGGGGNTAPSQELIKLFPHVQWDTFATIGVNVAEQGIPSDQTSTSAGFPIFINTNNLTFTNHAVFTAGPQPQGRADFAGDGDLDLRVLLMQLTVVADEYPSGQLGFILWQDAGGTSHQETFNLTWNVIEPLGRCCVPTGSCIITLHAYCAQFNNGYWLACNPCTACEQTCLPDIAPHPGNGVVDIDDLLAVINAWGPCSPWETCPPDVAPGTAGNNVVDIDDLLVVINGWGSCN